jgi:hypothetical protein
MDKDCTMLKKFYPILLGCLALLSTGCSISDDAPNFHFEALEILDAELPEAFTLNESYQISVSYIRPDSCTSYEGFDISKEGVTIRNVTAIGSVRTDMADCEEINTTEQAFFNFTVIYREPYIFRFFQGENEEGDPEYFEVTVPVN